METKAERDMFLDALMEPAFLVEQGIIVQVNKAAADLLIRPGEPVAQLLHTGSTEYTLFEQGNMYLTLNIGGEHRSACVCHMDGRDLFRLEKEDRRELTALSLAAMQLREPLSKALLSAERLYDPESGEDALRLNRGLYQMLRILGNMADAGSPTSFQETVDISAVIAEVFEKAGALLAQAGAELRYETLETPVYSLADPNQLERAILNILSNGTKYAGRNSKIEASLTRREDLLLLSIRDNGQGISGSLLPTVFTRYQREPGIEDARNGLGLGMVLIKDAAESHGGTVLIDTPENGGTRITLTISIRQREGDTLRSPTLRPDRYGDRDHALIELSDVLPPEVFDIFE